MAPGTGNPYSSAMPFLDSKRNRAAFLIFVLGIALVWTLWPFSTGLIGAPVLYVVFAPVFRWLSARMRPGLAAGLVVLLGVILILAGIAMLLLPGQGLLTILVGFFLVDVPAKYKIEQWLMRQPVVHRPINWLRKRAHRPPLQKSARKSSRAS